MENVLRKPYEISLWDDRLVFKIFSVKAIELTKENYKRNKYYYHPSSNAALVLDSSKGFTEGRQYYLPDKLLDECFDKLSNKDYGQEVIVIQHHKETKLCVIGSNVMDSPLRASQAKLVSKINGENTLTFNLYSRYYNEDSEQIESNPFLKLLVNERKVKLRLGSLGSADCEWYDFIIKEVKENSDNKAFSYTCKDLFINELSKTGFGIQLDPELENNMGTICQLAETILDESDWQVGDNNDIIDQTKEEPLYALKLNKSQTAINMQDTQDKMFIEAGKIIYVFYSDITNKETNLQFLYCKDEEYQVDDDRVITNSKNWYITNVSYSDEIPSIAETLELSYDFRGDKLIYQQVTLFDQAINQYVKIYEKDEKEYYGYQTIEYITPTAVKNFITNGEGFTNEAGWRAGGEFNNGATAYSTARLFGYPEAKNMTPQEWAEWEDFRSFLVYNRTSDKQVLHNSGFSDHRSSIEKLAIGDKYVFRAKISKLNESGALVSSNFDGGIELVVGEYTLQNGEYELGQIYFTGSFAKKVGDWYYCGTDDVLYLSSLVSKSTTDLKNKKVGIFFKTPKEVDVYFEEIQFYNYVEYERLKEGSETEYETVVAEPGCELFSAARTRYVYYDPDQEYKDESEIVPIYNGYEELEGFSPVYNKNKYEKVRSITASESNRFNLIQDLCEAFECWARFKIEHEPNGEISLDENYRQKKWITFHEYIGKPNYAGFRYGINLKSISRTLNSDGIVSKIIVKDNSNEFAPNGFCSIARSKENPTRDNFVFNFNYYIQQGLLNGEQVHNDLYSTNSGFLGYYKKLKELNALREPKIDELTQLEIDLMTYESNYQTYKLSVEGAEEEKRDAEQKIVSLTDLTLSQLQEDKENAWWDSKDLKDLVVRITHSKSKIAKHSVLRDLECVLDQNNNKVSGRIFETEKAIKETEEWLSDLADSKRALNLQFYKKYSRFIQEGSWISEDHVDENLYYLDAESTLFTSSKPKVTYTINVLELSQLEGYENFKFALGDKTFIEDIEFFGWKIDSKTKVRTPYHEEVVISEMSIEFDSPEKSTFKVQNFKTQFEDLFQRITATTQSLEYHSGEYGRASSIVQTNGTISAEVMQHSLDNNSFTLKNAKDQSVELNEEGLTTRCLSNPSQLVRIVSGGIFISQDGGLTWNTGITGNGINANFLTAGQINTAQVNIMGGTSTSFRWDTNGISAYWFSSGSEGAYGFNPSKYVRFDHYGIYGISGNANFIAASEDDVWNNANYALTWKGFMLKNSDGSVRISSEDDIQVLSGSQERIKIGRIENTYGIKISNENGATVMKTDDRGELWLENRMRVGQNQTSTVEIGYLENTRHGTEVHEVIRAGDSANQNDKPFIVYEDGRIVANYIEAKGGKIGGMDITSFENIDDLSYSVIITSNKGNQLANNSYIELTATLYKGVEVYQPNSGEILEYQWFDKNRNPISEKTTNSKITIVTDFDGNDGYLNYSCQITVS